LPDELSCTGSGIDISIGKAFSGGVKFGGREIKTTESSGDGVLMAKSLNQEYGSGGDRALPGQGDIKYPYSGPKR
jgi:hypothetical protein